MNRTLLLIPALVAMIGCYVAGPSKGTDTGNGLAMGLTASHVATDAQGTEFEVAEARAHVKDIDLFLPAGIDCEAIDPHPQARCNPSHYIIEGPFEIDLVTRTASPAIEAPIPAGTYKRVDVRFESGTALGDRTLVGSGTFDDGGTPTAFDFGFRFDATLKFESANGVVVDENTVLLALLDVTGWLETAPITDCLRVGDVDVNDGRLQLADGRGRCRAIENDIVDAVKKSGRLER